MHNLLDSRIFLIASVIVFYCVRVHAYWERVMYF